MLSAAMTGALSNGRTAARNAGKSVASKTDKRTDRSAGTHMIAAIIRAIAMPAVIIAINAVTITIAIIAITGTTITTAIIGITGTSTGITAVTTMAITIATRIVGIISGTIHRAPIIGVGTVHSTIIRGQRSDTCMIATMCRAITSEAIMAITPIRSS